MRLRCHLLAGSGDGWDLEQSLLSLVGQQGVQLAVWVHAPDAARGRAREACARLAPLSSTVTLNVADPDAPRSTDEEALAIWTAGTLGTPDHFTRAVDRLRGGTSVAVAGARRMRLARIEGSPPYVLSKTWRWTSPEPALTTLAEDPAFLGRCVVRRELEPPVLPDGGAAQLAWAQGLWARTRPARIDGFPSIDLPDLRPESAPVAVRDRLADLRYQLPRRLERAAPLTFARARAAFHRFRSLRGGGRD